MPTLITRYVNTASTPGGDGTTNETTGANRAYAGITEWEAAEQTDLVANDQVHHVLCCGATADNTNGFNVAGWTVDATRYIIIEANPAEPDGRNYSAAISENHYRIVETANGNSLTISSIRYTRLIGLQIYGTPSPMSNDRIIMYLINGDYTIVNGCKCLWRGGGTNGHGIDMHNTTENVQVRNCFVNGNNNVDFRGLVNRGSTLKNYFSNNTIVNGNIGIDDLGTGNVVVAKNNLIYNCTTSYDAVSFDASSDYNSTDNAETTGGANDRQSQTFDFANEAGLDYSLTRNDTGGLNVGTDLSGDADNPVTEDNRGVSRPQDGAYDIGAFESIIYRSNPRAPSGLGLLGLRPRLRNQIRPLNN